MKKAAAHKPAEVTATGNTAQAALMRLQATHGNGYVQKMMVQRQAAEQAERKKLNKEVTIDAPTSLDERGELTVDLSQLLNLRKFGSEGQTFAEQIEEWRAFGQLMLDEKVKHPFLDMEADQSGMVKFAMGAGFVHHVRGIMTAGETQDEPNLNDFCGAQGLKATATLHYNLEDSEIKESKLEIPTKMKSGEQKFLPYPVMLLKLEGDVKPLESGKHVKLEGAALFQPILKEEAVDEGEG